MSKLQELINELCSDGMEYKTLKDISLMERGQSLTKAKSTPGEYPVISGGKNPAFYCDKYNREGETITVAGSGTAGYVQYFNKPIFANDCFTIKGRDKINTKYLYYYLASKQEYIYSTKKVGGVPHVYISDIENIKIPVPPLPIQEEIVRILNKMTDYIAELKAELKARKMQYEYYRDELLTKAFDGSLDNSTKYEMLGNVCTLVAGATPSKAKPEYWENGTIPWMSSGEVNFKRIWTTENKITQKGYDNASTTLVPAHSIVIALAGQGKTRGKVAITEIELCTNQSLCSIICGESVNYKYLYYYLDGKYEELRSISNGNGTRGGLSLRILTSYKIPVIPLEMQNKIVNILDRFDTICNDLSTGLPAEIEARQKQYEYYRDKLLSFQKLENEEC